MVNNKCLLQCMVFPKISKILYYELANGIFGDNQKKGMKIMMKNLSKRFLASILSIIICVPISAPSISAFADEIVNTEDNYELGLLPPPEQESEEFEEYSLRYDEKFNDYPTTDSNIALPTSCDLSETPYFPLIGNQRGGSCASWSTTYYQFTYEANRLNNINTQENNETAYSPVYTFSYLNGGENVGAYNYEAYDFLKEHGALRLDVCGLNDNLYTWSTNTDAMIEALNTRVSDDYATNVSTNSASKNLNEVKQLLYGTDGTNGKVLSINTTYFHGWKYKQAFNPTTNTQEWITTHSITQSSGSAHAMTVVGYDDNIWCDFNGNEEVEEGELGAFKVANSHGTSYCNNGFVWVSYDALNATSLIDGWESETETRRPIFQHMSYGKNSFYWIEVENKEVSYVGQLHLDTINRNSLNIFAGRQNLSNNSIEKPIHKNDWFINKKVKVNEQDVRIGNLNKETPYLGTLVFDYGDLADPIGDYITDHNWFVNVTGIHNSLSFKITDNLSNTVVDFGDISTGSSFEPINLYMGDLNYNGVIDIGDSKILMESMHNGRTLSNLQSYLSNTTDLVNSQPVVFDYIPVGASYNLGLCIKASDGIDQMNYELAYDDLDVVNGETVFYIPQTENDWDYNVTVYADDNKLCEIDDLLNPSHNEGKVNNIPYQISVTTDDKLCINLKTYKTGDINLDGSVDSKDISILTNIFFGGYSFIQTGSMGDLSLGKAGSNITVNGNISANGMFTITGDNANINGTLSASGGMNRNISGNMNMPTGNNNAITSEWVEAVFNDDYMMQTFFSDSNTVYRNNYFAIGNTNITQPTVVNGDVDILGNTNINAHLKAYDDIIISGDVQNTNNGSVIYSETGDIEFTSNNINFNGFIYAPNGTVTIKGDNITINGLIIAKNLVIEGNSINFNVGALNQISGFTDVLSLTSFQILIADVYDDTIIDIFDLALLKKIVLTQ